MKQTLLFAVLLLVVLPVALAERKPKIDPPKAEAHINWISIDDLQYQMKKQPKKVFMDMYTDWCGWCKHMEATTFSNPDVVKYMNANYYCVRFNAERKDTFRFMGTSYYYDQEKRVNTLAFQLMQGKLSYPTSVIMEERYQNPQAIPGYLKVPEFEMIVRYFAENAHRTQPFPEYQKNFKGTWKWEEPAPPAPGGH
jgi:thioredoxin-related protein